MCLCLNPEGFVRGNYTMMPRVFVWEELNQELCGPDAESGICRIS